MNTTAFSVDITETPTEIKLTFNGSLSESGALPPIPHKNKTVLIDMLNIKYINSYGIKLWCQWVSQNDATKLVFQNCPFVFVKHLSAIRGMWTANMQMQSFFVPFYSEASQERKDVLLTEGTHFTKEGVKKFQQVFDSKGNEMELDVNANIYFEFLK